MAPAQGQRPAEVIMNCSEPDGKKRAKPVNPALYEIHMELFFSACRINQILEEIMKSSTYKASENCSNRRPAFRQGNLEYIKTLLEKLDPDMWYGDWLRVLMAIFYESGGSEEGFDVANEWSSRGYKYKGEKEVRYKWDSFDLSHPYPITIGTLIRMAKGGN